MNNQVLDTIKKRRTTRAYLSEQIKKEQLQIVLEAGLYAPSAHNQQSWHFTVIQNQNLIAELNKVSKEIAKDSSDEMIKKMASNETFNVFYNAPTLILVSGNKSSMMPQVDCAAASENMLIAAESINLGSCWNGFVSFIFNSDRREEYIKKLKIPEGYDPYYAIAIGYKKTEVINAPKRKGNNITFL